jgi:sugar phosphate isomerase/epimerase
MLQEMAGLGFRHVELSHGIRITLVPGILRAVRENVVAISSTHNFCPLPTGVTRAAPNLYEPSAADPRERDQWRRHTQRSIDFAAQVNAPVLICHLGSVRFSWFNPGRRIREHVFRRPTVGAREADRKFQGLLEKSQAKLAKTMPPFWTRARRCVHDIVGYAREKGVRLGLENREKFEELPSDSAFGDFLAELGTGAPVGYWHDTGHAALKERMGLVQHRLHLETLARVTLGFHLHDVSADGHDHQPIGSGQVDFDMVSRFWRPEHTLTLEFSPRVTTEQVRDSKRRIESLMV